MVLDAVHAVDCEKIVVIGAPVDALAEKLTELMPGKKIIGFGGQLDLARMKYALLTERINVTEEQYIIGEHGPKAIPVYKNEEEYEKISLMTTTFIKRIMAATDKPRNMATGV